MKPNNMPRPFAPEHSETDILERLRGAGIEDYELDPGVSRAAAAEIERLRSALRYEQHRSDRIGTHGPDCHAWGPAHWECAMREIEQLRVERDRLRERIERAPMTTVNHFWQAMFHFQGNAVPEEGKRVRLVVEEG